ncbi:rRNA maturation RNase YbeY [bacterium]|nr:rRNA maturation RNase YbeY [bacterium]
MDRQGMIVIHNTQRRIRINQSKLKREAHAMLEALGYGDFDLGIRLTTNTTIRRYNKAYRSKDKATDILSFPYHTDLKPGQKIVVRAAEDKNMGDLIISLEYVQADAPKRWGRYFDDHLTVLLAHGIAHLLNYDHITDEEFAAMQKVEKKLLKAVGFALEQDAAFKEYAHEDKTRRPRR